MAEMDIIEQFKTQVKGKRLTVALPEGHDERVIQAARIIKDQTIAIPILIGKPEKVKVFKTKRLLTRKLREQAEKLDEFLSNKMKEIEEEILKILGGSSSE